VDIQGRKLDAYFREIAPWTRMQFMTAPTATTVLRGASAAESGRIDPRRYDSYLRLRFGGKLVQAEDDEIDFETFD
jgi:hypothetical protein